MLALPFDIFNNISTFLPGAEFANLSKCCKTLMCEEFDYHHVFIESICKLPKFTRSLTVYMKYYGCIDNLEYVTDIRLEQNLHLIDVNTDYIIHRLPKSVEFLTIGYDCHITFQLNEHYPNLKYINAIGHLVGTIPSNVTHLYGLRTNMNIAECNLESLSLDEYHNNPLGNLPNLKSLKLGKKFNQLLGDFPKLEILTMATCGNFNQPLGNLPNLKKLVLRGEFNQPLKNYPLEELLMGTSSNFVQHLGNYPQLKKLKTHCLYKHSLTYIPPNLHTLIVSSYSFTKIGNLPSTLRKLRLHNDSTFRQVMRRLPPLEVLYIHLAKKSKKFLGLIPSNTATTIIEI